MAKVEFKLFTSLNAGIQRKSIITGGEWFMHDRRSHRLKLRHYQYKKRISIIEEI